MHSVNKANFAITYWFGLWFELRFTKLAEQLKNLYCCGDPLQYEKSNIDQILVTLGIKEITQSTLIRKLCTYKQSKPTRNAVFEFDRPIRSIYTLRYLRDPQIERNSHRSQNRIESYHQLRAEIAQVSGKKVSSAAWRNIHFNGHYAFRDSGQNIDLDTIVPIWSWNNGVVTPAKDSPEFSAVWAYTPREKICRAAIVNPFSPSSNISGRRLRSCVSPLPMTILYSLNKPHILNQKLLLISAPERLSMGKHRGLMRPQLFDPVALTMTYNAIHPIKPNLLYKMTDSKTYLNVPFAQKDEAKAIGARWDAVEKKWFVPSDKDITLFARWQTDSGAAGSPRPKASSSKIGSTSKKAATGAKTLAADKGFVAYNGDIPPWD
jgi:hypothetical protein